MAICETCNACCTIMSVSEIKKRPGCECSHSGAGGCAIYADRPTGCRTFECLYLRDDMDPEFRPDRCGVVLCEVPYEDFIFAHLHPDNPDAWRKEPIASRLRQFSSAGKQIILRLGDETYLLSQNMTARKVAVTMRPA